MLINVINPYRYAKYAGYQNSYVYVDQDAKFDGNEQVIGFAKTASITLSLDAEESLIYEALDQFELQTMKKAKKNKHRR